MTRISFIQFRSILAIVVLSSFLISCSTQATSRYWGQTKAPTEQVMRYVSGSEPESLYPQVPTGQPEARVRNSRTLRAEGRTRLAKGTKRSTSRRSRRPKP